MVNVAQTAGRVTFASPVTDFPRDNQTTLVELK
jgi:hypothetical protein